ncbi:PAN/Apple domain-containing protein, partial [Mesorhizobium sp.]
MAMRVARGLSTLFLLFFAWGSVAQAAEARRVVTSDNSDYFGFDLRSDQNVSLDQCRTTCLGDPACRAFTYNPKAKWCFLKSDFNTLKSFNGAVAGKVVNIEGDPDIGAPPDLAFFPAWMADQAQQYRNRLTGPAYTKPTEGLTALREAAEQASLTGDHRSAMQKYEALVSVSP